MRIALTALVGLAIGLALGAGALHWQSAPHLQSLLEARDSAHKDLVRLQTESEQSATAQARLARELQYAEDTIADLRKQAGVQKTAVRELPVQEYDMPAEDLGGMAALLGLEPPPEVSEDNESGRREGRGRRGGRDRGDWQARGEERREFAQQMRENVQGYLAGEFERATDPAARERLQAMTEYTDHMFDLRRQMSETEDPEEREALHEEMHQAGQEARSLVEEQRNEILRQVASSFGVKPDEQDEFGSAMRAAMESPFFRMSPFMFSGGGPGGGRGGGRGGPGGR